MSDVTIERGRTGGTRGVAGRDVTETAVDTAMSAGRAWWDLMLGMQRASLASFSVYSPGSGTRITGTVPQAAREESQVVRLGEERLNVATRTVLGETTRVRRRVVAQPVEQEVTLREERVVIERRPAAAGATAAGDAAAAPRGAAAAGGEVLTETVIEMSDSRQVPQVWKSVHVAEEVVLRREVTERKARVRETLRRDVLEVEHDDEGRGRRVELDHEQPAELGTPTRAARHAAELDAARQRTEALAESAREAMVATADAAAAGMEDAARDAARGAAAAGTEAKRAEDDRKSGPAAGGPSSGTGPQAGPSRKG